MLPGQWAGLPRTDARRSADPLGLQRAVLDVEARPLAVYDALVGAQTMIAATQARQSLEQLGLAEAAAVLDGRLEAASQKQLPYADFLADLLSTETAARRERYLRTRTRLAHLPFQRTLDQFDFRFQPSIDKRQVRDLATLTFISEAANVLFLGPPGVGKTHLAIALGRRAIEHARFGPS